MLLINFSFSQKQVYNDIGQGILDNAWKGFNATLFAYGQTGSGKSWSVIGYGANKGIVPELCEQLFKGITANKDKEGSSYEVKFSMLEIYNEVAIDLLDAKNSGKKKQTGLKVRQHPKRGFYGKKNLDPILQAEGTSAVMYAQVLVQNPFPRLSPWQSCIL